MYGKVSDIQNISACCKLILTTLKKEVNSTSVKCRKCGCPKELLSVRPSVRWQNYGHNKDTVFLNTGMFEGTGVEMEIVEMEIVEMEIVEMEIVEMEIIKN